MLLSLKGFLSGMAGLRLLTLPLVLFAFSTAAYTQQTIFNLPSTDVLPKGKVYFELDSVYKFDDTEALTSFYTFLPRIVVGAGNRMEMGLNYNHNIQPGPDSSTLWPSFKWKAYFQFVILDLSLKKNRSI